MALDFPQKTMQAILMVCCLTMTNAVLHSMAPEVGLELELGYRTEADVYSYGVLLWEISPVA